MRPFQAAFDLDVVVLKMLLPRRKLAIWNGEAQVQSAGSMMRRDEAAWTWGGLVRHAMPEQQQHLFPRHAKCAHPPVMHEFLEPEQALVEGIAR